MQRIDQDLEEAIAYDRDEEIKKLEEEKDDILAHLPRVAALGGRSRLQGERERARQSVTKAIARTLKSLPFGAAHITAHLTRGYAFVYSPEQAEVWKVDTVQ